MENYKERQPTSVAVESEDISKWEMEVKPHIEEIYHLLLGEKQVNSVWERDIKLDRVMNELGASSFIRELERFNINEQFSDLDEHKIDDMCADVGQNYSALLEDNWKKWEVEPSRTIMKSVSDLLVHKLRILLRIIKDGGMKTHRENRGTTKMYSRNQENPDSLVG